MSRKYYLAGLPVLVLAGWVMAQPSGDPVVEGFRMVEVASVADAMEQLYGQRAYMSHDMRPLFKTKFAGPAVTVLLKKKEHKEGAAAFPGNAGGNRRRSAGLGLRHGARGRTGSGSV